MIANLGDAVPLMLAAGRTPLAVESTILDLTGATPRLLREGTIGRARLEKMIGQSITY